MNARLFGFVPNALTKRKRAHQHGLIGVYNEKADKVHNSGEVDLALQFCKLTPRI